MPALGVKIALIAGALTDLGAGIGSSCLCRSGRRPTCGSGSVGGSGGRLIRGVESGVIFFPGLQDRKAVP